MSRHKDTQKKKNNVKKPQTLNYAEIAFDEAKDGAFRPIIRGQREATEYTEVLPSSFLLAQRPDDVDKASPPSTTGPHKYMNTANLVIPKMVYENVDTDAGDKNTQTPEVEVFEVIADHDCLSMSAERLKVRRGDFVQAEKLEAKRALCSMAEQNNRLRGWIPREKLKLVYTNTKATEEPHLQAESPPKYSVQIPALPPKSPDRVTSAESIKPKSHDAHVTEAWFVGKMSRTECEQHFSAVAQECNFVIRESTYRIGDYTLSVQFEGLARHFPIKLTENNRYYIGKHNFKNLCHIVNYYQHNPLFHDGNQRPISLGEPLECKNLLNRTTSC